MRQKWLFSWSTELRRRNRVAEYVRSGGLVCPYCGADHAIDGEEFDVTNGQVTQDVSCTHCGRRWVDVYTLTTIWEG